MASSKLTVTHPSAEASLPALMLFPSGMPPSSSLHNKEGGLKLELLRQDPTVPHQSVA